MDNLYGSLEQQYGLPEGALTAIQNAEASGDTAVSPKGAKGRFQFMPDTAKAYNVDVYDPISSAHGAAKYLSDLTKHYGSFQAAVAHYNGGTKQAKAVLAGLEPTYQETNKYLKKVNSTLNKIDPSQVVLTNENINPSEVQLDEEIKPSQVVSESNKKPTFFEELKKPLSEMSYEEFKQQSLLPKIATGMAGSREQKLKMVEELQPKVEKFVGGVQEFSKHPVESIKALAQQIKEHPGQALGETIKGAIYDPESWIGLPGGTKVVEALAKVPVKTTASVGKGLGDITASTLGLTTGVGADTVKEAFKAGLHNKPEFWENLTGQADKIQVLQDAKDALQTMRENRLGSYKNTIGDTFNDATKLNIAPIEEKINNLVDSLKLKTSKGEQMIVGKDQLPKIQEVQDVFNTWKNDPELHTAQGLDALKRRIDAIYTENPKHTQAQRIISGARNAVKQAIVEQSPGYAKTMKNYENSLAVEKELERTLSLGPNANPETALKKLQSITRNNVQTGYGYRSDLVKNLEKETGTNLTSALSGQAMSSLTPRSLAAQGGGLASLYGLTQLGTPALAALPFQSPKVVGAAAYGAGKTLSPIRKMLKMEK